MTGTCASFHHPLTAFPERSSAVREPKKQLPQSGLVHRSLNQLIRRFDFASDDMARHLSWVNRIVANGVNLAVLVAHDQIRIHLSHFLSE